MKLLFITQNYHPNKGGMAESCDRIIRNFRKHQVEVHIIHFTNRKKKFHTEVTVGGSYSAVPIQNSEEFTLNLASEFIVQLPMLSEIQYIVAFGGHLPMLLSPVLSKWIDKQLITLIRGNDFDEAIFSKKRMSLLYALEQSTFVFTVTQEKKEKITKLISHTNVHFTHNGINTKLWEPTTSQKSKIKSLKEISNGKKRIVIIGQLKAKKGILEFSNTFSMFGYKESYEVWMIGDVEPDTKAYIETLDINVRFFSFVNKNELIAYYYAADIILIPSFYDGMPNVLLEAGATKNVVIASNVSGIKDVIEDQKDGFLFHPLQPSSLLEVFMNVHKIDQPQKDKVADRLYHKISTQYTEEKEIKNYLTHLDIG